MSFWDIMTHAQVAPFTLLLGLFFALCTLEIVLMLIGLGADLGVDLSVDVEVPDTQLGWRLLDWLGVGKVPFLISIACLLFCVGFVGSLAQAIQLSLFGAALPWPFAMALAGAVSLAPVRLCNHALGRLWPKDESSAVTSESFIGHQALVTLGTATDDTPAQIRLRDSSGTLHHAMAYADRAGEQLESGAAALIVGRRGAFFTVIRHPNPVSSTDSAS